MFEAVLYGESDGRVIPYDCHEHGDGLPVLLGQCQVVACSRVEELAFDHIVWNACQTRQARRSRAQQEHLHLWQDVDHSATGEGVDLLAIYERRARVLHIRHAALYTNTNIDERAKAMFFDILKLSDAY